MAFQMTPEYDTDSVPHRHEHFYLKGVPSGDQVVFLVCVFFFARLYSDPDLQTNGLH